MHCPSPLTAECVHSGLVKLCLGHMISVELQGIEDGSLPKLQQQQDINTQSDNGVE